VLRRYFSSEPLQPASKARIGGPEAHHLAHVLRAQRGMEVALFDGRGGEYLATVERVGRTEVELAVGAWLDVEREPLYPMHLGVSLPKGERQRWLVEKAVELGVTRLTPLVTQRGEKAGSKGGDRLERYVVEACKQCGRNRLMEIGAPVAWEPWLQQADDESGENPLRWVAHPGGAPLSEARPATASSWRVAIGPEGGFSDEEIDVAQLAGWQIVGLGPRILRIETAALLLAAIASSGEASPASGSSAGSAGRL
jgi:16S rRNA (uracil1498-N3)-methyltransferase